MSTVISTALCVVLLVISALHALWAARIWWPIRDEVALARAVVGQHGITQMPSATACAAVAAALCAAAFWPFLPSGLLQTLGLLALTAVFLGRGAVAYAPFWQARVPEEPFATNDRRLYGPLCLAIGVGFGALLLGGVE